MEQIEIKDSSKYDKNNILMVDSSTLITLVSDTFNNRTLIEKVYPIADKIYPNDSFNIKDQMKLALESKMVPKLKKIFSEFLKSDMIIATNKTSYNKILELLNKVANNDEIKRFNNLIKKMVIFKDIRDEYIYKYKSKSVKEPALSFISTSYKINCLVISGHMSIYRSFQDHVDLPIAIFHDSLSFFTDSRLKKAEEYFNKLPQIPKK